MNYSAQDIRNMFPILSTEECQVIASTLPVEILDKMLVQVIDYLQADELLSRIVEEDD